MSYPTWYNNEVNTNMTNMTNMTNINNTKPIYVDEPIVVRPTESILRKIEDLVINNTTGITGTIRLPERAECELECEREYYPVSRRLCEQYESEDEDEEKIFIDDMDLNTLADKVKLALGRKQLNRVWIFGERLPSNEIVRLLCLLRKQLNGERIRCVFFGGEHQQLIDAIRFAGQYKKQQTPTIVEWIELFKQLRQHDMALNVYKYGQWHSYRQLFDLTNGCDLYETQECPSPKYKWTPGSSVYQTYSTQEKVLCDVEYVALNKRREVKEIDEQQQPGRGFIQQAMEFSGVEYKKDIVSSQQTPIRRVMGLLPCTSMLSNTVKAEPKYLWECPRDWTMEEAATVPLAYATAYHALVVSGQLKRGETVLIEAPSSPLGQAAIRICLAHQCRVFLNVRSQEKRDYLRALFGEKLIDECFVDTRDLYFEKKMIKLTNGLGLDICFNVYGKQQKPTIVMRIMAKYGRYLDMPASNCYTDKFVNNSTTPEHVRYVQLESIFECEQAEWTRVYKLVEEAIRSRVARPLKPVVFGIEKIDEALRFIAQTRLYQAKVVLKINKQDDDDEEDEEKKCFDEIRRIRGGRRHSLNEFDLNEQYGTAVEVPRIRFTPAHTYIITGCLSVLGLELVQWIVEHGARRVLLSHKTTCNPVGHFYLKQKLMKLQEQYGARVQVVPFDVEDEQECLMLVKEACMMSPIKKIAGIFHIPTVLAEQYPTVEKFEKLSNLEKLINFQKLTNKFEKFEQFEKYEKTPFEKYEKTPFEKYEKTPFEKYEKTPFEKYEKTPFEKLNFEKMPFERIEKIERFCPVDKYETIERPCKEEQTVRRCQYNYKPELVGCKGLYNLDKLCRTMTDIIDESAFLIVLAPHGYPVDKRVEKICENRKRDGKQVVALYWEPTLFIEMPWTKLNEIEQEKRVCLTVPHLRKLEQILIKNVEGGQYLKNKNWTQAIRCPTYKTVTPIEKILFPKLF